MTATTHLITTDRARLHPIGVRGQLVIAAHQQIARFLSGRFGQEYARLFAEPILGAGAIDWFTDAVGPAKRLAEVDETSRVAALQKVQALVTDIQKLSGELAGSAPADQRLIGEILSNALIYPGDEYLFLVGDQPVVACWGVKPGDPTVTPQSLARLGRDIKIETSKAELVRPARSVQGWSLTPPAAPERETETKQDKKPKLSWTGLKKLGWVLLALILLLLLLLLWRGCAGVYIPPLGGLLPGLPRFASPPSVSARPGPGTGAASSEDLAAARRREDLLRQELTRLRLELANRQRGCSPGNANRQP